jgi:hypothetical protein
VPDPRPFARRSLLLGRSERAACSDWPVASPWAQARVQGPEHLAPEPSAEHACEHACEDAGYGTVRVRAWAGLHPKVSRGARGPRQPWPHAEGRARDAGLSGGGTAATR